MNEPVPAVVEGRKARPERGARAYDSAQSLADILRVASAEFADKGLAGARIDEIAAATRTSKRMIYYHFESKESLYVAVLENAYRRIREIETNLNLQDLGPEDALRRLVAFTFDYHQDNEAFIRLVMNENMQRGEYLAQSSTIQELNVPVISAVRGIYERGVEVGQFRRGLDPVDLHMAISALCFFNVANRHTFGLIFKRDLAAPQALREHRDQAVEMIVRFVRK